MIQALEKTKSIENKPLTGLSVEVRGASDALSPTAEAVGFRATQL